MNDSKPNTRCSSNGSVIVAAAICMAALCSPASSRAAEIYAGYGVVTGAHLGLGLKLSTHLGVRAEGHSLNINRTLDVDGSPFRGEAQFQGAGAYLDLHPFGGSFRVVAGIVSGKHRVAGKQEFVGNTVEVGDRTFSAKPGDEVSLTARFPGSMPYLGIGWGHQGQDPGLSFFSELGFMFGKPTATILVSNSLRQAAGVTDADVRREEQKAQAELDKLKALPVLKFGVGYAF